MSSKKGYLRPTGRVITAILNTEPGKEISQPEIQKAIGVTTGGTSPIFIKALQRGYLVFCKNKKGVKYYLRTEKMLRTYKNGKHHPKRRTVSEQQLPLPLKSESTSIRDLTIDLLVCQYKDRLKSMHDNSLVELLKKQFAQVLV